jgi:hypothetical protein
MRIVTQVIQCCIHERMRLQRISENYICCVHYVLLLKQAVYLCSFRWLLTIHENCFRGSTVIGVERFEVCVRILMVWMTLWHLNTWLPLHLWSKCIANVTKLLKNFFENLEWESITNPFGNFPWVFLTFVEIPGMTG